MPLGLEGGSRGNGSPTRGCGQETSPLRVATRLRKAGRGGKGGGQRRERAAERRKRQAKGRKAKDKVVARAKQPFRLDEKGKKGCG